MAPGDLGFPRIRGTVWGVSRIRIILFWDLYWGPLFRETAREGLGFGVWGLEPGNTPLEESGFGFRV